MKTKKLSKPVFKKYYRHTSDKKAAFKVGDIIDIRIPKEHLYNSNEDILIKNAKIFKIRYHRFMDNYIYVYKSRHYVGDAGKYYYAFSMDTYEPYMTLVEREPINENNHIKGVEL